MADTVASRSAGVPVGRGQEAAEAERAHDYTGEIRRADRDGNEIRGFLIDRLGARITLRGCKDPRRGHGYQLYGEVTHIPQQLRLEAIDG